MSSWSQFCSFAFCFLQGGVLNIATTHDGRTPLHVACLEGQLQVIRYLLVKGASPHVIDKHGQTPLHDAIRSANEDAILLLREFGAHLGPTTVDTALKMCSLAADDKVDRLRAWHLAGVDFNVGDYDRRTALHVVSVLFLTGWEGRKVAAFGQNLRCVPISRQKIPSAGSGREGKEEAFFGQIFATCAFPAKNPRCRTTANILLRVGWVKAVFAS